MFNGAPNTAGSGKRIEVPEDERKYVDNLQSIHAPEPEAGAVNLGKGPINHDRCYRAYGGVCTKA